jgi:cytoskeletal protein CcmA (bactofilin family)
MKLNRLFVYLILIFLLSATVLAERGERSNNDAFVLNDTYIGNLYLSNPTIKINSDLQGELYAISNAISVNNVVEQDIGAITNDFTLKGTAGNNLRVVAGNVYIDGPIFNEAMLLARNVEFTNNSVVAGPVNIQAKTVILNGKMLKGANIKADKVILNGEIDGNAVIEAGIFEMGPSAKVTGDLSSNRMIQKDERIGGSVIKFRDKYSPENAMSITFGKILFFLMILLIGAAAVLVSKKYSERTAKAMYGRFWLSLLMGIVVLIIAPIAGFLLLLTVIGIPITLLLILAYFGVLIVSLGFSAVFLGRLDLKMFRSKRKNALWLELVIGAIILALLSFIPVIFWIILIFLMITAVGGMFLAAVRKEERKKDAKTKIAAGRRR